MPPFYRDADLSTVYFCFSSYAVVWRGWGRVFRGSCVEFFKEARILFEVIFLCFLLCIEQIDFFFVYMMIRMPITVLAYLGL